MTTRIPEEIAHLDFDPDSKTDEKSGDAELHECQMSDCTRVADWIGRMGCCKYDFYCCDACRKIVSKNGVKCKKDSCGKSREARWITGWRRA